IREREGHDLTLQQIFEQALASHLEKLEQKNQKPIKKVAWPAKSAPTRYIRKAERHAVAERSQGRCEYVDPLTERRCESRYRLQFEHRIPFSLGGGRDAGTPLHYCAAPNRLRA